MNTFDRVVIAVLVAVLILVGLLWLFAKGMSDEP